MGVRRSQINDEDTLLKGKAAVLYGRVHALPAFFHGRIRKADNKGAFFRHGAEIHFHLHFYAIYAQDGGGIQSRHHSSMLGNGWQKGRKITKNIKISNK